MLQTADAKSYNWPMAENALYTRFAEQRLTEALEDSPIALVHGPRQCGKATLALVRQFHSVPSSWLPSSRGRDGIPQKYSGKKDLPRCVE